MGIPNTRKLGEISVAIPFSFTDAFDPSLGNSAMPLTLLSLGNSALPPFLKQGLQRTKEVKQFI